ncbi:unnamed protein product [Hyaloperonospora brassicae]|uniref:DEAD/DEAH-box helicase domain-containing protein n=1 Tax=Hyaloperonospora brassicae TaxID=162125 RepID=A0AAV0TRJ6_HYABA|nr:unnamed protein product [Hyaloperonospora brassicae]
MTTETDAQLYVPLKVRRQREHERLQQRLTVLQQRLQHERSDSESASDSDELQLKKQKTTSLSTLTTSTSSDSKAAEALSSTASIEDQQQQQQRSSVILLDQAFAMRENVSPPIKPFEYMRFSRAILDALKTKKILRPTLIQVQAMPRILAGRDMIGIAFTGSGKTVTFTLPLVMLALEEETKMPVVGHEGPFGLIAGPSHKLMR